MNADVVVVELVALLAVVVVVATAAVLAAVVVVEPAAPLAVIVVSVCVLGAVVVSGISGGGVRTTPIHYQCGCCSTVDSGRCCTCTT